MTAEAALAAALLHVGVPVGADELAAAILAAMPGWTLVPTNSDSTIEHIEGQRAEIARLQAALVQAHERMDVAWNVMHPGDLTLDEREAIAQALWFGMAELDALAPSEP